MGKFKVSLVHTVRPGLETKKQYRYQADALVFSQVGTEIFQLGDARVISSNQSAHVWYYLAWHFNYGQILLLTVSLQNGDASLGVSTDTHSIKATVVI